MYLSHYMHNINSMPVKGKVCNKCLLDITSESSFSLSHFPPLKIYENASRKNIRDISFGFYNEDIKEIYSCVRYILLLTCSQVSENGEY